MKGLQFTNKTSVAARVLFIVYFFYAFFYLSFVQALVSVASGGIAYAYTESYEVAFIAALVVNFLYPFLARPLGARSGEGFVGQPQAQAQEPLQAITKRVGAFRPPTILPGVGSKMSEGFEDAAQPDMSIDMNKAVKAVMETMTTNAKESKPGFVDATPTVQDASGVKVPAESFEGASQAGLFKLGAIPTDAKGGFHIDTGTTVMNALNALKPDQLKAMTNDTKQLIETQKSLMSMLQTFKPMMSEGKQMMDTFQEMFQ
jgi:hypothetical protein